MIPYEEALERVLAQAGVLPPEQVELRQALGRMLARDVMTREAIPLFDQSAVDGYGVRAADLAEVAEGKPARLKVAGEIRAGEAQPKSFSKPESTLRALRQGEAIRIFTGAMVPRSVDSVVMREVCAEVGGEGLQKNETRIGKSGRAGIDYDYEHEHEMRAVLIRQKVMEGANIRRRGEEFAKGTCVLRTGTRITPPVIGLLATLGYPRPMVHRTPNVTLLVTGSELKEPGERLGPGQIRDANGYALAAALEAMGIPMLFSTRVGDDPETIREALAVALRASDVVVTAGGVWVGDYDFIKDVAAELGVETVFWKVAIKPGMPNYFGTYAPGQGKGKRTGDGAAKKLLFGLPGNPVAALVSFYLFVRPALFAMAGAPDPRPKLVQATLKGERRKTNKRLEWVRGVLEDSTEGRTVTPAGGQESHMLGGLAGANGLIEFPAEATVLEDGAVVRVLPLEWEF